MKDKGQATFLIIVIIAFLGIGIYAGIKIFGKQEKKNLELDLAREAQELFTKISADIQKKDICSGSLSGNLKTSLINKIISTTDENETTLYKVGQTIGRLKIDRLETIESLEDLEHSVINFKISVSNFNDSASKELVGLKTFKTNFDLKVDDCNSYFIAGANMLEAESRCAGPVPDGIRGKITDVIIKESVTDTSVLIECRSCRLSSRKVILSCLN